MSDDDKPTLRPRETPVTRIGVPPPKGKPPLFKRRTPSAPMAALSPTAYADDPQAFEPVETSEVSVTLDDETRDRLLLKAIARLERIDTENEQLVEKITEASNLGQSLRHDMALVVTEVRNLRREQGTMKTLLRDILVKLD